VDGYPFQVVTDGPRQLALWTQPIDQSTVLYGLLVTGVNPDALAEMALETRLEALHRINTQAGLVPGE
ncbi:MAG TPA: hypothetical protein VEI97_12290, partial [bacterium]|nr:hypothetical protein [bacterium]